jgi:hypothetical protein
MLEGPVETTAPLESHIPVPKTAMPRATHNQNLIDTPVGCRIVLTLPIKRPRNAPIMLIETKSRKSTPNSNPTGIDPIYPA